MKVAITFWLILFMGCLFLGFQDVRQAQENAVPVDKLTPEQDLIARKNVTVYKELYHDFFILSNDKVKAPTLIHDLCQYVAILSVTYLLIEAYRAVAYYIESYGLLVRFTQAFLVINIIDLLDYFLTHNSTFFSIGAIPVTWNTLSVLLYPLISIYIYIQYEP